VALCCALATAQEVQEEEEADYTVELDPGEQVVLQGRIGQVQDNVVMSLGELQDVFGITEEMKRQERLTVREKRRARECRKRGRLYRRSDQKCYKANHQGICPVGRWFVAEKGRLDGVCQALPCSQPDTPVLYQGTCSPVFDTCGQPNTRLYLNKKGRGFCGCDEGFSYNHQDSRCYRERTRGPCPDGQTWLSLDKKKVPKQRRKGQKRFGKCRRTK